MASDWAEGLNQGVNNFFGAYEAAQKRTREQQQRQTLAELGAQGGDLDFNKIGRALLLGGNVSGAMAAAQLAQSQGDREWRRQVDERDHGFRVQEADRAQGNTQRNQRIQAASVAARIARPGAASTAAPRVINTPRGPQQWDADNQKWIPAVGVPPAAPADDAEKPLPGELGARITLGQKFLDDLEDRKDPATGKVITPGLVSRTQRGDATGWVDQAKMAAGYGDPAEAWRMWRLGSESIVRNLTGAGMPAGEARDRVKQWEPTPADTHETALKKLMMLKDQVQRMEAEAYRGRGVPAQRKGKNPYFDAPKDAPAESPKADAAAAPSTANIVESLDHVPDNKRFKAPDGRIGRKVNGQVTWE